MQSNGNQFEVENKKWKLLYLTASHGQMFNNLESILENLGKKLSGELNSSNFTWHWINDKRLSPSCNWLHYSSLDSKKVITEIDKSSQASIQAFIDQKFRVEKITLLALPVDFSPFKHSLLIPVGSEGKVSAILQFYSTESEFPSLIEKIQQNILEFVREEINRQLDYCKIHERERDQVVQLAQASRLSSLGAMAGGIAHEINNPVTIIMGMLKMVIKEINGDKPIDREKISGTLEKARQYTERISKIVKGIRALSRDGSRDPFISSKVQDIIDSTFGLCEASIQTNSIQLSYDIEDPTLSIDCRPVQISQVLLNLINNSLDAIGDRKNPWIHVAVKKISEETVEFSVTDCGEGIPENIANQLMQPFFTTKGAGKGTGLGLSISQEIIKAHHGTFALDRAFQNTRFYIHLPIDQSQSDRITA